MAIRTNNNSLIINITALRHFNHTWQEPLIRYISNALFIWDFIAVSCRSWPLLGSHHLRINKSDDKCVDYIHKYVLIFRYCGIHKVFSNRHLLYFLKSVSVAQTTAGDKELDDLVNLFSWNPNTSTWLGKCIYTGHSSRSDSLHTGVW